MIPRRLRPWLVLVAATLLFDQVVQYTLLRQGTLGLHRVAPFDPPIFTETQGRVLDRLIDAEEGKAVGIALQFDPDLGWAPPSDQKQGKLYAYDWAGTRISQHPLSREVEGGVSRIAIVGCSFTRGDEVQGDETWAAYLTRDRDDLEIANLGMGGHGIDQALLRWRRDGKQLEAAEVWLGIMPPALRRITTQYPPAQRHWAQTLYFKPRFLLGEEGELVHVPNPALNRMQVVDLIQDQTAFFEALRHTDSWVQRAPSAWSRAGSSWTHYFASTRLLLTWREGRGRDPVGHVQPADSEVRRLTVAICRAFHEETREAGADFRVLLLPSLDDLALAREGDRYWSGLLEELQQLGIPTFDTTDALLEAQSDRDPEGWMPGKHYAPRTNQVIAEALEPLCPGP